MKGKFATGTRLLIKLHSLFLQDKYTAELKDFESYDKSVLQRIFPEISVSSSMVSVVEDIHLYVKQANKSICTKCLEKYECFG